MQPLQQRAGAAAALREQQGREAGGVPLGDSAAAAATGGLVPAAQPALDYVLPPLLPLQQQHQPDEPGWALAMLSGSPSGVGSSSRRNS